ncbi:hypothetical protein Pmani_005185 [Petrolisthes manimaculis]|uniref:Uncharacterized protein n=1 Tax=Petrolisthes manimaculis TaxID=1843537 RepID=A0AAE1UHR9_9EUCA|nr:hypothetical protein Pmani_005185 [Petrolisthes manimaculis]
MHNPVLPSITLTPITTTLIFTNISPQPHAFSHRHYVTPTPLPYVSHTPCYNRLINTPKAPTLLCLALNNAQTQLNVRLPMSTHLCPPSSLRNFPLRVQRCPRTILWVEDLESGDTLLIDSGSKVRIVP